MRFLTLFIIAFFGVSVPAHAEFIVSSAIVEFKAETPPQADIELISRSQEKEYVAAEVAEIVNPGLANETREMITDPAKGRLLVTPDKAVLGAGSRKVMRFVLLKPPENKEHIYRVAVKPVIKGVDHEAKVGLKVLVGYEVLVIIRPATIQSRYQAQRSGKTFTVTNTGNSNVLFQNGKQCEASENCKLPPVLRVYPGQTANVELPYDGDVTYSIWDGNESVDKTF